MEIKRPFVVVGISQMVGLTVLQLHNHHGDRGRFTFDPELGFFSQYKDGSRLNLTFSTTKTSIIIQSEIDLNRHQRFVYSNSLGRYISINDSVLFLEDNELYPMLTCSFELQLSRRLFGQTKRLLREHPDTTFSIFFS